MHYTMYILFKGPVLVIYCHNISDRQNVVGKNNKHLLFYCFWNKKSGVTYLGGSSSRSLMNLHMECQQSLPVPKGLIGLEHSLSRWVIQVAVHKRPLFWPHGFLPGILSALMTWQVVSLGACVQGRELRRTSLKCRTGSFALPFP